jgi:hypothetical protein
MRGQVKEHEKESEIAEQGCGRLLYSQKDVLSKDGERSGKRPKLDDLG